MNDDARDSSASRGSGLVTVIAVALCVAGDLSMAVQVPPFDAPSEWQVRRDEERECRAQAIADAPIRQVEATRQLCVEVAATRQLCDEIAALRKEVAELRAEVAEMRKRK